MIGKTISHYKILEKLGEGGMGVVYKAEDTKLERPVALKFLSPSSLGTEEERIRFIREAKAAAALAHSNVCTIHEIDEVDDKVFIAMEYLEGQTLDKKIKSSALDIDEAVNIALRVAEGLRHAHKREIVHRDIKPANIMITNEGQAKIMDFGLAKLTGRTRLTKTATVMGTIAYMSPEQARGDKDIGHQTDIWSLGIVLYEMLTGKLPFDAETDTGLIYKVVNENHKPVKSHRSETPDSLGSIIEKALQKGCESRYANARELIDDLESVKSEASVSAGGGSPSIAVLPFVDMSPAKDQEYFCDGISETLINELTQFENLTVIARTSAFSFKGQNLDVRDIGRKLSVETILEGSIQKAGNRIRITAQLVDTSRGRHLWSEKYDRELDDIFAIQDEITETIVDKLKPKLLGEERTTVAKRQTVDLKAYNLYLKGRWFIRQSKQETILKAIECFDQAIQKEPGYAPAYAGLADCYIALPIIGPFAPKTTYPKAREAALKALQLDDTLAEAHRSFAIIRSIYDWEWESAETEYRRAIELNPGHTEAHQSYGFMLMYMGRHDEAISEMERALELDPLSIHVNRDAGLVFCFANEPDRAITVLQRAIEMNPDYGGAHFLLGWANWLKSKHEEATAEFQVEMDSASGLDPLAKTWVGIVCALTGKQDEAREIRKEILERSEREYVPPFFPAYLSFALRENDRGFEFLERAYVEHDPYLCYLNVESTFEMLELRSDPRYLAMLKKIGLDK